MQGLAPWFAERGWRPFEFQRAVWDAMARGESGLLHANTGSGKTYAVWGGALARAACLPDPPRPAGWPGPPSLFLAARRLRPGPGRRKQPEGTEDATTVTKVVASSTISAEVLLPQQNDPPCTNTTSGPSPIS